MILIVMMFVLLMYALLSAFIIYASGKAASWLGYNPAIAKKRIKILWFAPVIIWLVWDLPTIPLHKYYCATQAGFFVYKTPEQWLKEHPEVTREELRPLGKDMTHLWDFPYRPIKSNDFSALMLNKKIEIKSYLEKVSSLFPITKHMTHFSEIESKKTLAKQVTFSSGYPPAMTTGGVVGFKSWLNNSACNKTDGVFTDEFKKFLTGILTLGEEQNGY